MSSKKGFLIFVILSLIPIVLAQNIEINGFVNDYANIINLSDKARIEGVLKELYDSKTAEFAVVTVDSLNGQDIESYALNLAQGKLGDKEKNNGLLLLVAVNDHKYRFEVGRGIEPLLNDAKAGRIGRTYLVENFRNNDYGKGVYEAALAVKSVLMGDKESEYYIGETNLITNAPKELFISLAIFLMIPIFIVIVIILSAKRIRSYKKDDKYFNAALMAGLLFGKGGGRGGGFGGGGGGFGGFGGGGASGGW